MLATEGHVRDRTAEPEPIHLTKTVPWGRILLEGVVIVFSILVAFGVDAWWGGRQQRARERDYLVALRNEFVVARGSGAPRFRLRAEHSAQALVGQVQGEPRAGLDSLYWWMSGLSQQIEFDPPRAVLDDLTSSGDMRLIQSDSLRLALAAYPALLEQLRHADEQAWTTWEQRIQSFLEGRVPRVDRLRLGTFGDGGRVALPFGPSPHATDWYEVLGDRGFESMLAERWMRVRLASGRFEQATRLIDDIVRLIDARLGGADQGGTTANRR